jgi:hypothetical protein
MTSRDVSFYFSSTQRDESVALSLSVSKKFYESVRQCVRMTWEPQQLAFLIGEMEDIEQDNSRRSSARAEARRIKQDAESRLTE